MKDEEPEDCTRADADKQATTATKWGNPALSLSRHVPNHLPLQLLFFMSFNSCSSCSSIFQLFNKQNHTDACQELSIRRPH